MPRFCRCALCQIAKKEKRALLMDDLMMFFYMKYNKVLSSEVFWQVSD